MLDFLVAIFHLSFYVILYVFLPLTALYRAYSVYKAGLAKKEMVLSIIDISSYCFLLYMPETSKFKKAYRAIHLGFAFCAFLAFAFAVHMYF